MRELAREQARGRAGGRAVMRGGQAAHLAAAAKTLRPRQGQR